MSANGVPVPLKQLLFFLSVCLWHFFFKLLSQNIQYVIDDMLKFPHKQPLDIAHDDLVDQDNVTVHNNKQVFRKALWCLLLLFIVLREKKTLRIPFIPRSLQTHYTRLRGSARSDKWMSQRWSISYNEEFLNG